MCDFILTESNRRNLWPLEEKYDSESEKLDYEFKKLDLEAGQMDWEPEN